MAGTPYTNYSFLVLTLRDPFSRCLSTFTYQHPVNRLEFESKKLAREFTPVFECFPTLEIFSEFIGDDPDSFNYTLPITSRQVDSTNCTNLARAIMKNRVPASGHFYFDLKTILDKSVQIQLTTDLAAAAAVPAVLVIRTEHLWEDWTSANLYLGQFPPVATFPDHSRSRDFSSQKVGKVPKVTKDISEKGRERLCRALKENYRAYLAAIHRSANLTPEEKEDSLALARTNCPIVFALD
jgi:hypothetical protein